MKRFVQTILTAAAVLLLAVPPSALAGAPGSATREGEGPDTCLDTASSGISVSGRGRVPA